MAQFVLDLDSVSKYISNLENKSEALKLQLSTLTDEGDLKLRK
jgi:hypothetical protein